MAGGEKSVLLYRGSDQIGLGFSLLGTPHLPPIIYDILENSPAAESGQVEAGDVILKINETDVNRWSTKEVLKCLRLSGNPVRLQLKRDPEIKEQVIHLLQDMGSNTEQTTSTEKRTSPEPMESEDPFPTDVDLQRFQKPKQPRFEAFMMTGDVILNLSRNQQTAGLLPKHQKKIDSLRNQRHRATNVNSVPTSPSEGDLGGRRSESLGDEAPPYAFQTGVRTSKSEDHLQIQKDPSLSTVDIDIDDDVTSSLNTLLDTRQDSSCGSLHDNQTLSDPSSNVTVLQITEQGWANGQSHVESASTDQSGPEKVQLNGQSKGDSLANGEEKVNGQTRRRDCGCAHQMKGMKNEACACSPLREKRRRCDKCRHSGHYEKCEHRHRYSIEEGGDQTNGCLVKRR